jgi:hypothetical protein
MSYRIAMMLTCNLGSALLLALVQLVRIPFGGLVP